jgi:hypothetical protein
MAQDKGSHHYPESRKYFTIHNLITDAVLTRNSPVPLHCNGSSIMLLKEVRGQNIKLKWEHVTTLSILFIVI